jgi:hypothetical protein
MRAMLGIRGSSGASANWLEGSVEKVLNVCLDVIPADQICSAGHPPTGRERGKSFPRHTGMQVTDCADFFSDRMCRTTG